MCAGRVGNDMFEQVGKSSFERDGRHIATVCADRANVNIGVEKLP